MSQWPAIADIASQVQSGSITATELVERSLQSIENNKSYDAVIASVPERARERAKMIDAAVSSGNNIGPLAGVPFIAKDNFLAFGAETTAASNILRGFTAPYQATAIEKLEAAGAICVAKANLDAFAHGSSTENSDFMITKNPHDKTRVPGGSSGGSAAAVMLDIAPFALGTDTGGSIRLPAAFCGAVGLKPTYGLVSRSGVVAMASSTDVVGPLTRTVADAAVVLDIIAGKDELDATTIDRETSYICAKVDTNKPLKIGVIEEYMNDGVNPQLKQLIESQIETIKASGIDIVTVSLPSLVYALACYYIVMPAEVSSNLSRYDGQRYGFTAREAQDIDESYNLSRSQGFGAEAKRRIMIGTYVLSSGYYDAYYKTAQQLRTKLISEFDTAFDTVDFLIGPTAPSTAFKIGANTHDPLQMYLTDIMTVAANIVGIPAISIPGGLVDGLPVGLQIMGRQRQDKSLLDLAKHIQEII
ncbi:MAG: Asp-tRNA(Asn)/Glu-tRNA(Gln) amidotransferase subunit GatA [Candidatus Saccharimonadales bacterium]